MSPLETVGLVVTCTEGLVAIILNSAIVAINSQRVKNGLRWNQSELIQLVMGLVNITMRCTSAAQTIFGTFWPSYVFIREICSTIVFLQLFHTCFSFWLTASLCTYYCTTITSSNCRLFLWMKKSLSPRLSLFILLAGFGSLVVTFPVAFQFEITLERQSSGNGTHGVVEMSYNMASLAIISVFGCFLPFIIIFLTMMTTVSSLVRHIQKMRNNEWGFAGPKLRAHTNAIRTMLFFLTLSVGFYIAETHLYIEHALRNPATYAKMLVVTVFPTAEAAIIIQANPLLRRTILGWFCRARSQDCDT